MLKYNGPSFSSTPLLGDCIVKLGGGDVGGGVDIGVSGDIGVGDDIGEMTVVSLEY